MRGRDNQDDKASRQRPLWVKRCGAILSERCPLSAVTPIAS
jgi:hypothetical protein